MRGRAAVARCVHYPKVSGSIPLPATKKLNMIDNTYTSKFKFEHTTPDVKFFKNYIAGFNVLLNFTNTEVDLLSEILYHKYNTNPESNIVELDSKARRVISKNLGITVYNFNNVFQRLKNRGVFTSLENAKQYRINIPVFSIQPKSGDKYVVTYSYEVE